MSAIAEKTAVDVIAMAKKTGLSGQYLCEVLGVSLPEFTCETFEEARDAHDFLPSKSKGGKAALQKMIELASTLEEAVAAYGRTDSISEEARALKLLRKFSSEEVGQASTLEEILKACGRAYGRSKEQAEAIRKLAKFFPKQS